MLYTFLFLVRYYPFWAIPASLVFFELGTYHYHRRERILFGLLYGVSTFFVISSILWVVFEGYWRAPPFLKRFIENYGIF
jgi:hypothetical protein